MLKRISILMLAVSLLVPPALLLAPPPAAAQEGEEEETGADRFKTRRTPTMREAVYKKLAEAQELADANDLAGSSRVIDDLADMRNLNSYEMAQMYNFRAYLAYSREDYAAAIRAYESLLSQPDLPEALETGTLYSVSQLYMAEEQYAKGVDYLRRWFSIAKNPQPSAYYLLGQGYYLLKRYNDALEPLRKAVDLQRQSGNGVNENWLLMVRACYYELGDFQQVVAVQEELIRMNPKKQYWVELSGFYSEINEPAKQLYALEIPYRKGLLDRGAEYVTLGQLLMQANIPYRGAKVIAEGMEKGLVEEDSKNLRLLSQAWMLAQEFDKALGPLKQAARLADDGELYYHLANSLWNLQRFNEAADAAAQALDKGDLKRPDQVLLLRGMALFNEKRYQDATQVFRRALRDKRSEKTAAQWLQYIEREQLRLQQLADAL